MTSSPVLIKLRSVLKLGTAPDRMRSLRFDGGAPISSRNSRLMCAWSENALANAASLSFTSATVKSSRAANPHDTR